MSEQSKGGLRRRAGALGALVILQAAATLDPAMSATVAADRRETAAEAMPIIVTYELKKRREAERIAARNPRGFWIRQIVARIEDRKPELDKALKEPVTVEVTFVVGHDGHLVSKALAKASGNPTADRTAIALLEKAAPFPPMPEAMTDADITFNLPVRFH